MDGKYCFSLSEEELLASGVRIGNEYDQEQLAGLQQAATLDKGMMRALDYLARRPRSEWEVRDYLRRKEYDSPTIEALLSKLSNYGYIDDVSFARAWIRSRRALKPTSLRRLRQELAKKRVGKDDVEEALEGEPVDEVVSLRRVIEKKRQLPRYQDQQKLIAYLVRQGFRYDDIKTVLSTSDS